jgi:hypothetical protein
MSNSTNNFDIPKGGYVSFDALSLRELIINRLNEQKIFTDQNFLGSNLACIIDIIAYSYHTLIYYLNKTSSESMFTESQLYENINRIVKLIDYSPIGFQTSTLSFNCSASNLIQGLYTIPRYSYLLTNNINYSFNEDITFSKTENITTESLDEMARQKLLFQGQYQEYPVYTAIGEDNETIILNAGNALVDHFNIDVFVKPILTNKWIQYSKTPNLFLENGSEKKYEIRLNQNKRYEIKFGNDINGLKLQTGDKVAIYYLSSKGVDGEIGAGALNSNSRLYRYNTIQFNEILTDIFENDYRYLSNVEMSNLNFTNSNASTPIKEGETPEEIRQTAPATYRSQYRLVTTSDFETFVKSNFSNLIADVKCVNNWGYVSGYQKYFYDLGLKDPSKTERTIFNQIFYADACNFNNVYLLVVPRSASRSLNYLLPAQKELINSSIQSSKLATIEPVFLDPIYKAVSFGITSNGTSVDPFVEEQFCELEVIKRENSKRDNQSIIKDIDNIFNDYFSRDNLQFGKAIDTRFLTQQILTVDGVETFYTKRTDDPNIKIEGLSLFFWNPVYFEDVTVSSNNITLKFFEYPFFNNLQNISSKIKVTLPSSIFEGVEY